MWDAAKYRDGETLPAIDWEENPTMAGNFFLQKKCKKNLQKFQTHETES